MKRKLFKTYRITQEGLAEVRSKLAELQQELTVVNKEMQEVRRQLNQTDSAESVSYTDFLVRRQILEGEIAKTHQIIENAKVIRSGNASKVAVGCKVLLSDGVKKLRYTIVNSFEANPLEGKISDQSPLGKALIGRRLRERIRWSFGRTEHELTLMKIEQ